MRSQGNLGKLSEINLESGGLGWGSVTGRPGIEKSGGCIAKTGQKPAAIRPPFLGD